MSAERRRLARLRRLATVRAIARQSAALEAAQAESTLMQLRALSERTRRLAGEYGGRREIADGFALHQLGRFVLGLHAITRTAEGDTVRAQSIADAKQQQLAEAERRRAAIEERAALQARLVAKMREQPVLGGRRSSGTELE